MTNTQKRISPKMKASAAFLMVLLMLLTLTSTAQAAFKYEHDPMQNPNAARDIIVDENAVYGYSPNPDSTRLGAFASHDWSNADIVEKAREERIEYLNKYAELYSMIQQMTNEGKDLETITRAAIKRRNEIRTESYRDNPEGLISMKKSNLEAYGHEEGPTPDELYEKYGSWEIALKKVLTTNPGMDACLGLYDIYYPTYRINAEQPSVQIPESGEYEVKTGDSLFRIAAQVYRDGRKWRELYEKNRDRIKNPALIYRGQMLRY